MASEADACSLCGVGVRTLAECDHVLKQSRAIFNGLNKQRLENADVCDVTIHVRGKTFKAHMCVLMCSSRFFQALFSQRELSETEAKEVTLDLDVEAVEWVMDFIYTGKITFSFEDVESILQASDYLLVEELCNYLKLYLDASLNVETCLKCIILGKQYSFPKLYDNACIIFKCRLEDCIRPREMFSRLSLADLLVLCSDNSVGNILSDHTLKQLIIRWIQTNFEYHASEELAQLLLNKRLEYDEIKTEVDKLKNEKATKSSRSFHSRFKRPRTKKIKRMRAQSTPVVSVSNESILHRSVSQESQVEGNIDLIIVNGHGSHHAYIIQQDRWVSFPPLPDRRNYHRMVQLNHEVYLLGGSQTAYVPSESCLDLVELTWRALPPTNHVFLQVEDTVVTPDAQVCLFGQTGIAERYDPVTKTWLPLDHYKIGHGLSEVRAAASSERLFICFTEDELFTGHTIAYFSEYNLEEIPGSWRNLAAPPIPHQTKIVSARNPVPTTLLKNYNMFVKDDTVYLCNVQQDETKRQVLAYDITSGEWTNQHELQKSFSFHTQSEQELQAKTLCWDTGSCVLECDSNIPDRSHLTLSESSSTSGAPLAWIPRSPPPFMFLQDKIVVCQARLTALQAEAIIQLPTATYMNYKPKY